MASEFWSSENVRLARSRAVSAIRIASGKRLLARRVSSLSLRMAQSFSSPFMPRLPALAQLGNQLPGQIFRGQRQGLSLVSYDIRAHKETCSTNCCAGAYQRRTITRQYAVFYLHGQNKFGRGKHVPPHRASRTATDIADLGFQCGVAIPIAGNLVGSVLLKLFDNGVGYDRLDARQEIGRASCRERV